VEQSSSRFVVSVLVADRVGILRDITSAIADLDGNIDAISQTVVENYFTVILTATWKKPVPAATVQEALTARFGRDAAAVAVRPYAPGKAASRSRRTRYVVILTGPGKLGLLKAVTSFLAERGINIEDWFVEKGAAGFTHIGLVSIPDALDIKHVQDEIRQTAAELEMTCALQHENIFRATNEVGPIKSLLRHGEAGRG